MFISWGTKEQKVGLGYVADFCPICRQLRPFRLVAIKKVWHVCGVPVGRGRIIAHHQICHDCRISLEADERKFAATASQVPSTLGELIAETHPNIYTAHGSRLRLEEQVKNNPSRFGSRDRMVLIKESFEVVAPVLQSKYRFEYETEFGFRSGIALLLTLAAPILILMLAINLPASSKFHDYFATAIWVSIIAGVSATTYFMATARERFIQSQLMPLLCRALKPLKPDVGEIDSVLSSLRSRGFKLGEKLTPRSVMTALTSDKASTALGNGERFMPISPNRLLNRRGNWQWPWQDSMKRTKFAVIATIALAAMVLAVRQTAP